MFAAVALFLGGVPPIFKIIGYDSGLYDPASSLLQICWIISGIAAVYLAYRWNQGGRRLFGGHDQRDMYAFLVSIVSGINLGWMGLSDHNIGFSITYNRIVLIIVGVAYVWAAFHLYKRWKESNERVF